MLLAVDPGIRHCGVGLFRGENLYEARLVKNPCRTGGGVVAAMAMAEAVAKWARDNPVEAVSSVVCERMKIYPDGKSPGDPNVSILPLIGVQHVLAGLFNRAVHFEFLPREWKGSVDGVAMTLTVRERLTDAEFKTIGLPASACAECRKRLGDYCLKGESGCGADHVFDAIGIGLKHLNRLERRRVYPR
jgi:hypothetical protein